MASTIFPTPSTSSVSGQSFVATTANYPYNATATIKPGAYSLSFSGGGTLYMDFYNGSTYMATLSGTTGTNLNITFTATRIVYYLSAGSSIDRKAHV